MLLGMGIIIYQNELQVQQIALKMVIQMLYDLRLLNEQVLRVIRDFSMQTDKHKCYQITERVLLVNFGIQQIQLAQILNMLRQ